MDRILRAVLPPLFRPGVVAAAVVVAAGMFVVMTVSAGFLGLAALDPWQAAAHGITLALMILLYEDAYGCERWRRDAQGIVAGSETWAERALRLCAVRVQHCENREAQLSQLGALRHELSRLLAARWAGRYVVLSWLPVILGLVAGLSAFRVIQASGRFLDVFGPTLFTSAEALVACALAYLLWLNWEEVLDVWYTAAKDRLLPESSERSLSNGGLAPAAQSPTAAPVVWPEAVQPAPVSRPVPIPASALPEVLRQPSAVRPPLNPD
jgi:hypothetical protein